MTERVADYLARRCAELGASHVFMVTGGGAMHLNDAFGRIQTLEKAFFHHEQAAAMAAESYFRLGNKPCVLNVTTGPGGINALNGVFGAYVDSLAMIVISGQVKRETYAPNFTMPLRQLGDQEVDIVSMARSVVKFATVLQDPMLTRREIEMAFHIALEGRPGPVWIDVPIDVQGALIDSDSLLGFCPETDMQYRYGACGISRNTNHALARKPVAELVPMVEAIVRRLQSAKRPVLFAGAGIRISGQREHFLELAERLGIPAVSGWNAHDVLPSDHLCYAGRPGTVGDRAGNFAVQNADFVLVLGSRLNIRQVSYNWANFAPQAWKAIVDADLAELQKPTLQPDFPVHADLRDFIPALGLALKGYAPPQQHAHYLSWCKERIARYPVLGNTSLTPKGLINPYALIARLFALIDDEEIIVTGDGTACVVAFQAALLKHGQRLYTNSGCASMGYDLPGAIGACYAAGRKRVVCLAGDGSIMMNLQELQTIVGSALPIKIVILNNQGYHSIRQTQNVYFPDNEVGVGPNSGVTFPDFVRIGTAFGLPSKRCADIALLDDAIVEMLLTSGPSLLEVMLDTAQAFEPKLASRRLPDGRMESPTLDDMSPFLSREELNENRFHD